MEEKGKYATTSEMQAAIDAHRTQQATACLAAIEAVLKQYNCRIEVTPAFTPDGRVVATVQVACVG